MTIQLENKLVTIVRILFSKTVFNVLIIVWFAMGSNTKWATLSQEVIRRMKNTSQRVCGAV